MGVKKEHTIPSDDEPRGIMAPLKEKVAEIKGQIIAFFHVLFPVQFERSE